MIELFPVLARGSVVPTVATLNPSASQLTKTVKNQAWATSPRIREQFPQLAYSEQTSSTKVSPSATSKSALAIVLENRSLATSPRMKEQFPELARSNIAFETDSNTVGIAPLK